MMARRQAACTAALRLALLSILVAMLSSCALVKLPEVCELDALELEARSLQVLLQPDILRFANETIAGMSARTLDEASGERIGHLITWQSAFPRCGETPVPMSSQHRLGQLVLARTGAGYGALATALSSACWQRKFRNTVDLFAEDRTAPIFCDSLDPALVLDTNARRDEDAATLQSIREAEDSMALFFLGPLLSDARLYAYRYMEQMLPAIAAAVKEELAEHLPPASRKAAKSLQITLVYDTDVLFARVPTSKDRILISAPVLRSAYAGALNAVLPAMERLRTEYAAARDDPAKLVAFRDRAIEATDDIVRSIWVSYRQSLAFVLAHEMAHVYAAEAGEDMTGERVADCFAVTNLVDWNRQDASPGMFDLLVDDAVRPAGGVWVNAALPPMASQGLRERKRRVSELLLEGRRSGSAAIRAHCAAAE